MSWPGMWVWGPMSSPSVLPSPHLPSPTFTFGFNLWDSQRSPQNDCSSDTRSHTISLPAHLFRPPTGTINPRLHSFPL